MRSSALRPDVVGTVARRCLARTLRRVGLYCWVGLLLLAVLGPLWWLVRGAFATYADLHGPVLYAVPAGWPPRHWPPVVDWSQFRGLLRRGALGALLNSLIVAGGALALTVALSVLAAYSLARLRYPGRDLLARSLLLVYLVPQDLLFIPTFATMRSLHLVNTIWAPMLADLGLTAPFCAWLLVCYLRSVPVEVEEAALVDGCGRLGALLWIDLPLALPGVIAAALISFTLSWGESLYAFVLELNGRIVTLAVLLANTGNSQLLAGALLYALPVVALYLLGQRFLVEGLAAGAVQA